MDTTKSRDRASCSPPCQYLTVAEQSVDLPTLPQLELKSRRVFHFIPYIYNIFKEPLYSILSINVCTSTFLKLRRRDHSTAILIPVATAIQPPTKTINGVNPKLP